jgi:lysophospholipase L1-like esterase
MAESDAFTAHWDARVAAFRKENEALRARPGERQVVLLGDSLTELFDVGLHFPGRLVVNRGINSDHLAPFEERCIPVRLTPELLAPNPSHVFILAGINDVNRRSTGLDEYVRIYRNMLAELRERYPGVQLVCQSLLPTRAPFAHLNAVVREFNRELRALAGSAGARFLDLHPLYADGRGELKWVISWDGLHPRPYSQGRWRSALEKHLSWPRTPRIAGLIVAVRTMERTTLERT